MFPQNHSKSPSSYASRRPKKRKVLNHGYDRNLLEKYEEIFENNLRIIKEMNAKRSKEINHEKQQQFYRWLIDNNLDGYLK